MQTLPGFSVSILFMSIAGCGNITKEIGAMGRTNSGGNGIMKQIQKSDNCSVFSQKTWYNRGMNNFGTGKSLSEASPYLQDEAERHARILEVAERNSVIEGLPPFTEEIREKLRKQLEALSTATTRHVAEQAE